MTASEAVELFALQEPRPCWRWDGPVWPWGLPGLWLLLVTLLQARRWHSWGPSSLCCSPGQDLFSLARACRACTWASPAVRVLQSPWKVSSSTQLNLPLTSFPVPKPNLSCLELSTLSLALFATGSRLSPAPLQHLFKCLRTSVSP